MKVIVLSCNTGEGHNTAGNAIIEGMHAGVWKRIWSTRLR